MKIEFSLEGVVTPEKIKANIDHATGLRLPYPSPGKSKSLAVVGASPSIADCLDELRETEADIWIICGAFPWAVKQGIKGTYFSIDPSPENALYLAEVKKAILASCVDPAVFEALRGNDVSVFDLISSPKRLNHGCTTATAVPELAIILDYQEITFYGCESSFQIDDKSHVFGNVENENWIVVECDGMSYCTRPDYLLQAQMLSFIIRALPKFFKERSGGLLGAMVRNPEFDITHVSQSLYSAISLKEAA